MIFRLALLSDYVFLVGQYESCPTPFATLTSAAVAALGAVLPFVFATGERRQFDRASDFDGSRKHARGLNYRYYGDPALYLLS